MIVRGWRDGSVSDCVSCEGMEWGSDCVSCEGVEMKCDCVNCEEWRWECVV